ncbi:hypothetical protein CFC21_103451 [Triticum aestivum]|uniref:Uncharacterized protein n=2 Tax=Triticum aestivum TaxID=4565 RepID=A0A9R1M867_WHEAT|nr:uncharacterized protein LOC119341462 [Triticum dicoccoides]XP_044431543.1 uncharacterized protein LOC123157346 [Triticum aestivum]KAF7102291.1 hypothetical protein CFC21_103448 [Triticum aestivum]KAF7102294.1 hypothetical protein CFC21_103451 [Triticum aestivum]
MGNCLNKASTQQQREMRRRHGHGERVAPEEREEQEELRSIGQVLLQEEDEEEEEEEVPASASPAAGMKVKVVLTRAELEWLMAQLKSGEQRLEDVLRQMGNARADDDKPPRADAWRPRLECILECPEAADAT